MQRLSQMVVSWLVAFLYSAHAELHIAPQPETYVRGPFFTDGAAALQRGAAERRPIWITAWDKAFFNSPEGQKGNIADDAFHHFFHNPETKNLLNQNFVQAFTTLGDPAIAQWIDPNDHSHMPVYIVLDAAGHFVMRNHTISNPVGGLKAAQGASVKVGLPKFADPTPPPPGWQPGPPSKSHVECTPEKYLVGTYTNDTAAALQRGVAEHWPVWIIAWDKQFYNSPDGQDYNIGDFSLYWFSKKPEPRNFISQNFIQVFTTTDDPAIAQWLDKSDRTHEPVSIVIDSKGDFAVRVHAAGNPDEIWKRVQEIGTRLGIAVDGNAGGRGNPPVVASKPEPRVAGNVEPAGRPPINVAPPLNPAGPAATPARVAINPRPSRLPAVSPAPMTAHISVPLLSAKTNKAARHISIAQSTTARTEQDLRWMSVEVEAKFFDKPPVEYQVQCFFIAKSETSPAQRVYAADVKTSRDPNFRYEFISKPLAGSKRTLTSVAFSNYDGSVVGSYNTSTTVTAEKVVGWIVRVVGEGRVLATESNQPSLAGLVNTQKDHLDAVASEVLATAGYTTESTGATGEITTAYMVMEGGVLHVPAVLNDVSPRKFIVDSGASDVCIPEDVYRALVQAGTIQKGDALPAGTAVLADGRKVHAERFMLHSIRVGKTTVTNVPASVTKSGSDLLLGQSFLRRFREWKIDNTISALLLTN